MDKTYVFEGKTTNEAIDNGLKELKVSKNKVDIKVLESEEKRSFFSILTPRVVKVEITLKEDVESEEKRSNVEHKEIKNQLEFNKSEVQERIQKFLDDFIKNLPQNDLNYKIDIVENDFHIDVEGEDTGYLIGYRGEVLNSLQLILTNIASKNLNCKVSKLVA